MVKTSFVKNRLHVVDARFLAQVLFAFHLTAVAFLSGCLEPSGHDARSSVSSVACIAKAPTGSLRLLSGPYYDPEVKNVIAANCALAGCHAAGGAGGELFSTYTSTKSRISLILTRTSSNTNPMPPLGLLPLATRNVFVDWNTAGLLERAVSVSPTSVAPLPTPTSSPIPIAGESKPAAAADSNAMSSSCVDNDLSEQQREAVDSLRFPDGMRQCAQNRQVFSRKSSQCVPESTLISGSCTSEWVNEVMAQEPSSVRQDISSKLADGWEVEQCGNLGADIVFYLIKIEVRGGDISLNSQTYQFSH